MGSRLNVVFHEGNEADPTCTIYGHNAGSNPVDAAETLNSFFSALESQTGDRRYDDPGYLAAKFVVYLAGKTVSSKDKPLDFLSVGCYKTPSDVDASCVAFLHCRDQGSRPTVRFDGYYDEIVDAYAILGQE